MSTKIKQTQSKTKNRLWTSTQMVLASFLAGPIGGCYLLGRNYKELGKPEHVKKCYWIGGISTILLMTLLGILPENLTAKMPRTILPVVYAVFIAVFANVYQKKAIDEKLKESHRKHSYFRCVFIGLAFLAIEFLWGGLLGLLLYP